MACEFLEYREGDDEQTFDVERAYCTAVSAFVQPMRGDVCNERFDLDPTADCEFYREAVADGDQ